MRLTKKEYSVLSAIHFLNSRFQQPDHHHIAMACNKAYAAADWAHSALRTLYASGHIDVAGRGNGNARRWAITENGRKALEVEDHKIEIG